MIDLNRMAKEAYEVAEKRHENGANIRTDSLSMLKHCATEVVEATEALINLSNGAGTHGGYHAELADIITCVLIIAGGNGIDIEQALEEVQGKNRARAEGKGDKK